MRCAHAGWAHRQDEATAWLRAVAETRLPPVGAALIDLDTVLPEMEFWIPSDHLAGPALDQLCAVHLLDGAPRPPLSERALHGILKGFADLVFEHNGRYYVLDYKSTALGADDQAYSRAAMAACMASQRYDVQGALYLLALHRLLISRLGDRYAPQTHLGGALFLFLRGIGNGQTRGCYLLPLDRELLDGLDALLEQHRRALAGSLAFPWPGTLPAPRKTRRCSRSRRRGRHWRGPSDPQSVRERFSAAGQRLTVGDRRG